MKILKSEKGFTLIELVLIIVILGILGAVATVQFGSLIKDANQSALDGGAGPYNTQLALTINTLKALPSAVQFKSSVFDIAQPSGGTVVHTAPSDNVIRMEINATCVDEWTYTAGTGAFTRTLNTRGGC